MLATHLFVGLLSLFNTHHTDKMVCHYLVYPQSVKMHSVSCPPILRGQEHFSSAKDAPSVPNKPNEGPKEHHEEKHEHEHEHDKKEK